MGKVKRGFFLLALAVGMNLVAIGVAMIHRYWVLGPNTIVVSILVLLQLLVGVLLAILFGRWLTRQLASYELFLAGALAFLTARLMEKLLFGSPVLDMHYPIGGWTDRIWMAFGMAGFAAVYYLYPKFCGRLLNSQMAVWHFWITLIAAFAICWSANYAGLAGMPRRYIDYRDPLSMYLPISRELFKPVSLLAAAQVLFIFNLVYSRRRAGKRVI